MYIIIIMKIASSRGPPHKNDPPESNSILQSPGQTAGHSVDVRLLHQEARRSLHVEPGLDGIPGQEVLLHRAHVVLPVPDLRQRPLVAVTQPEAHGG